MSYYSNKYMETQLKRGKSAIYSSILKYGRSKFKLEILEYCEPSEAVSREQYFLDRLKPEYNILKNAASFIGFKHSEETKIKMSEVHKEIDHLGRFTKGCIFTPEHLANLSAAKLGNTNATGGKGRKRAEGAGSPSVQIEVIDMETGMKTTYPSMSETAQALGVPSGSIRTYFSRNTQKPYKGRYLLQKLAG
jgi:group I intron endonuclease